MAVATSSVSGSRGSVSVDQVDDNSSVSGFSHALVHPTDYNSIATGRSSTTNGGSSTTSRESSTASSGRPTTLYLRQTQNHIESETLLEDELARTPTNNYTAASLTDSLQATPTLSDHILTVADCARRLSYDTDTDNESTIAQYSSLCDLDGYDPPLRWSRDTIDSQSSTSLVGEMASNIALPERGRSMADVRRRVLSNEPNPVDKGRKAHSTLELRTNAPLNLSMLQGTIGASQRTERDSLQYVKEEKEDDVLVSSRKRQAFFAGKENDGNCSPSARERRTNIVSQSCEQLNSISAGERGTGRAWRSAEQITSLFLNKKTTNETLQFVEQIHSLSTRKAMKGEASQAAGQNCPLAAGKVAFDADLHTAEDHTAKTVVQGKTTEPTEQTVTLPAGEETRIRTVRPKPYIRTQRKLNSFPNKTLHLTTSASVLEADLTYFILSNIDVIRC